MKVSRDPYNKVGQFILEELKQAGVTYAFACQHKVSRQPATGRRTSDRGPSG
jgi:hypothetical protein